MDPKNVLILLISFGRENVFEKLSSSSMCGGSSPKF